jgi:RNA polymerase subunit RPABC4/transcription elongation factor Spt4
MSRKTSAYYNKVKKEQVEGDFTRSDCNENEMFDEPKKNRKNKKNASEEQDNRKKIVSTEFLPGSMKKLRACIHCKIVMDTKRWRDLGRCPNCPSSGGFSETTDDFHNCIGQIYPKMSWVAQYQGIQNLFPGIYAMSVNTTAIDAVEEHDDEDEY